LKKLASGVSQVTDKRKGKFMESESGGRAKGPRDYKRAVGKSTQYRGEKDISFQYQKPQRGTENPKMDEGNASRAKPHGASRMKGGEVRR